MNTLGRKKLKSLSIIWLFIFSLSCSTISTAPYDEEIYQECQALQKEVNLFLDEIPSKGKPKKLKKGDIQFYSTFETGINQVLDKAKIYKNNEESILAIITINDTFEKMKELHLKSGISQANKILFKKHFSHQFKSLLDIERFKREKQI